MEDVNTRLSASYTVSTRYIPSNLKKILEKGENEVLVPSWFVILCKNGKCRKAPWIFSFEVKCKKRTFKYVKLNILKNGYVGFLNFSNFEFLSPKAKQFSKKIISTFGIIKKSRINIIKLYTIKKRTIFQSNISLFFLCNDRKNVKLMAPFLTQFSTPPFAERQNKSYFLNSETKPDKTYVFWKVNFEL